MSSVESSHKPSEVVSLTSRSEAASLSASGKSSEDDQQTVISQHPPITGDGVPRSTASGDLSKLATGERLDHFELLEFVGGGGMGAVFRAQDTMLNRDVAIKVLSRDQGSDEETRRRFQNEAQSAARLDHENIARVYYVGEDRGLNYIVFEFIHGTNLRDLVERKGALPPAEALSYTIQVAEALDHASSRDVVHRDIKPSNVIVTSDGKVKLVDMGLARLHQVQPPGEDLTASGVTLGTFDYISPEQARDPRSADVRSDIYSLGCTLYFVLTARPPFPEGTVLQKLLQHSSDDPPDPRDLNPALPEEVSLVIQRMLAKDPRRRYQSAAELVTDLRSLALQLGYAAPPAGGAAWTPAETPLFARWERHLPWLVPICALLLFVVALDRWWILPEDSATAMDSRSSTAPNAFAGESSTGLSSGVQGSGVPNDDVQDAADQRGADRDGTDRDGTDRDGTDRDGTVQAEGVPRGTEAPKGRPTPRPSDRSAEDLKATGSQKSSDSGPTESKRGPRSAADPAPGIAKAAAPSEAADPAAKEGQERTTGNPRLTDDREPPPGTGSEPSAAQVEQPLPTTDAAEETEIRSVAGSGAVSTADGSNASLSAADTENATDAPTRKGGNPRQERDVELPPGLRVVGDTATGPRHYRTLAAACAEAKSGDIIELRFNGRREEPPISLANIDLWIRAGEGFAPAIVFQPVDSDPVKPRSMITLAGGGLKLVDLALELELPRGVGGDGWCLLECRHARTLSLSKCVLTVKNASDQNRPYHDGVAFVNVKAAPGADSMMMPPGAVPQAPIEIELHDCVARGEATFLQTANAQGLRLVWENGLLATPERLLEVEGGAPSPESAPPIKVELRHLTSITKGGMCQTRQRDMTPRLGNVQLDCSESIFVVDENGALVDQEGREDPSRIQAHVDWRGNWNLYMGLTTFWRISDGMLPKPLREFDRGVWRTHWSTRENPSPLPDTDWRILPDAARPFHTHTAADYVLGSPMGAAGANLPGLNLSNLPPLAILAEPMLPDPASPALNNAP